MDQTYAEIDSTYAQITAAAGGYTTPRSSQKTSRSRNLRREFDSGLPIEYRYPKRNSVMSSTSSKQRSLGSKSSSSGYSSSGSVSSVITMVNGAKPYRPEKHEYSTEKKMSEEVLEVDTSKVNIVPSEDSGREDVVENTPKSRACCIECREKEIRQDHDMESHQYANLSSIAKPQDPYVFLMTSMLISLHKEEAGRKIARVQQKIEKVLRMKPREPFNVDHKLTFDRQVSSFAADVEIRLRAIGDVAPETYRDVSAKFCEALHHDGPSSKGLKGIVKGMKSLLNF